MRRMAGLLVGLVIAGTAVAAYANDPVTVAPKNYKKIFENEKVRVLDVRIAAGESLAMHSHPDHHVYVIEGGSLKLTHLDGTSVEVPMKPGEVLWIPAESHSALNTGTTDIHVIVNELKS